MRPWLVLVLAAGCYQPAPPANVPCGPDGACPTGFMCQADRCVTPGGVVEDATRPVDSSPVDMAGPADAPVDALSTVGCADGEREALPSEVDFPTIAGCAATWTGPLSLRATASGGACGDDLGACTAPADACAPGWHLCGSAGQPNELTSRVTEQACAEAGGQADSKFVAALSHCSAYVGTCEYTLPLPCKDTMECGEPVCCGAGCRTGVGCPAGVFAMTGVAGTLQNGCGSLLASDVTGVLCCR